MCTTTTTPEGVRAYTPSCPSRTVSTGGAVSTGGSYASSTTSTSPVSSSSADRHTQEASPPPPSPPPQRAHAVEGGAHRYDGAAQGLTTVTLRVAGAAARPAASAAVYTTTNGAYGGVGSAVSTTPSPVARCYT